MSTINRIFTDIFVSLSFQGNFPMTAPRHAEPRLVEPAPRRQPVQAPQLMKAPVAQGHRPAFG
ncbi:MAG TPA: hypothetical protein VL752_17955 [Acidisoma sp.]|uniref:hypothetical protein n=1 Tax=Acidisoma sp. TaxID=1872115 RepID=UPI002B790758|nr:hypothetical protein [Acidisoma sp.]HTI02837.1 hypothetical protein [Acidisoma sp.]